MKKNNTAANVNNQVPNISIDAEIVFIFNGDFNDRQRGHMKKLLDAKIAEHPELAEPIKAIMETLGI